MYRRLHIRNGTQEWNSVYYRKTRKVTYKREHFLKSLGHNEKISILRQQRPMPVNRSNLRFKLIFKWGNEEIVPFCLFTKVDANKTYLEAYDVLAVIQLFFPHALKISKSAPACM